MTCHGSNAPDPKRCRVADVADVQYRRPSAIISRVNGKDGGNGHSVESDANTVETTQAVLAEMQDMEEDPNIPVQPHSSIKEADHRLWTI